MAHYQKKPVIVERGSQIVNFHCPICGRFVAKGFWVEVPEGATFVVGEHRFVGPVRIYSCNDCTSKTVKVPDSQEVIVSMNWVEWNQENLPPESPVASAEPMGPNPRDGQGQHQEDDGDAPTL